MNGMQHHPICLLTKGWGFYPTIKILKSARKKLGCLHIFTEIYIYILTNSVPGLTIAKMMSSNNTTKLIMQNVDTVNLK